MFCLHFLLGNLIQRGKKVAQINKNVLKVLKDVLFLQFASL